MMFNCNSGVIALPLIRSIELLSRSSCASTFLLSQKGQP